MYTVSPFLSLSFLSFRPFLHTNRPTFAEVCTLLPRIPQWDSDSGVRGIPQNCPKFVRDVDASGFWMSQTLPRCQDPAVLHHLQQSLSTAFNHLGRSEFASWLWQTFPWGFDDLNDLSFWYRDTLRFFIHQQWPIRLMYVFSVDAISAAGLSFLSTLRKLSPFFFFLEFSTI